MPPYFVFIKKSGGIVAQYLFNKFGGGVFGASPRKIRDVETTPERGRRSSDNAETDINFDTTDDVTLTSPVGVGGDLTTWAGVDDVFVPTLYDQSATGLDVTQATAGNQPQMISSGALVTSGGLPAFDNSGKTGWLGSGSLPVAGSEYWVFMVYEENNDQGFLFQIYDGSSIKAGTMNPEMIASLFRLTLYASPSLNVIYTYNKPSLGRTLISIRAKAGQTYENAVEVYYNGVLQTNQSAGSQGSAAAFLDQGLRVFTNNSQSLPYDSKFQELTIFTGDKSSERTAIEADINGYFNIY